MRTSNIIINVVYFKASVNFLYFRQQIAKCVVSHIQNGRIVLSGHSYETSSWNVIKLLIDEPCVDCLSRYCVDIIDFSQCWSDWLRSYCLYWDDCAGYCSSSVFSGHNWTSYCSWCVYIICSHSWTSNWCICYLNIKIWVFNRWSNCWLA